MSHRIPNDPERVNVNDEQEAAYWCRELDCSAEELQEAVSAVGVQAADVRLHLGQATRDPGVEGYHGAAPSGVRRASGCLCVRLPGERRTAV